MVADEKCLSLMVSVATQCGDLELAMKKLKAMTKTSMAPETSILDSLVSTWASRDVGKSVQVLARMPAWDRVPSESAILATLRGAMAQKIDAATLSRIQGVISGLHDQGHEVSNAVKSDFKKLRAVTLESMPSWL